MSDMKALRDNINKVIEHESGGHNQTRTDTLNIIEALVTCEVLKALEGKDSKLKEQIEDLISDSHGVHGLHLNGDLATWDWLINNEWLSELLPESPKEQREP